MSPAVNSSQDKPYKFLVIGDSGVGKTSIVRRTAFGSYSANYKVTFGTDFALKQLRLTGAGEARDIKIQFWDIAGQERLGTQTRVYYKDADAAIIVFDLTRFATFEIAKKWREDQSAKGDNSKIPIILVGNKCDAPFQDFDDAKNAQVDGYVKEEKLLGFFKVSAQEDTNIEETITLLANKALEIRLSSSAPAVPSETVVLLPGPTVTQSSAGCSC